MVQSTLTEAHNGKCLLVDMGAFHMVEFAKTLCLPFLGAAVHGGVHVLQVVPQTLAMRMLVFPVLDNTFKVSLASVFACLQWHLKCWAFSRQAANQTLLL